MSPKSVASLSLDLDNKWSYMKTHGDPGWQQHPSYLDAVVPRVLEFLEKRNLKITFFIVGQDATLKKNHRVLRSIADAGHEIGNHSFHHEPWLHHYRREDGDREIGMAEDAILEATGQRPVGFRGPGYTLSADILESLKNRGYQYDASTFPTFLGPLARTYYFFRSPHLTDEEKAKRSALFGGVRDALRPIKQYKWRLEGGPLIEVPVTTMPLFRLPIHFSYLIYIASYSLSVAQSYLRGSLMLCRWRGVEPSLLLHPLDFLGGQEVPELSFFPGMELSASAKIDWCGRFIAEFCRHFEAMPILRHVKSLEANRRLAIFEPKMMLRPDE